MKKAVLGILGTAIALAVGTTSAFAAGSGARRSFARADSDGICDNVREGICSYVDTDGDGVCDNFASGQNRGTGHRNGFHHGRCSK